MTAPTAITVLDGEAEMRAAVGRDLGTTGWYEVTDDRLAAFFAATRASDASYLAISLSNMFLPQIVEVRGFAMGINYGTDTVRFGGPLQTGDRVRGQATLVDIAEVKGGIQTRMTIVVEVAQADDGDGDGHGENGTPACVVESLSRWLT